MEPGNATNSTQTGHRPWHLATATPIWHTAMCPNMAPPSAKGATHMLKLLEIGILQLLLFGNKRDFRRSDICSLSQDRDFARQHARLEDLEQERREGAGPWERPQS